MKLYIRRIEVAKNGKSIASIKLGRGLCVINGGTELFEVIKTLLGNGAPFLSSESITFSATVELGEVYILKGSKTCGEPIFKVSARASGTERTEEYFKAVHQNEEMDSARFFGDYKKQDYPLRLLKYKDPSRYYPDGEFAAITDGYGSTRFFRSVMAEYIKGFEPIRLKPDGEYFLKLSPSGRFSVGYLNSDERVRLSKSETAIYHCLCFVSVARFWRDVERMRDLNAVDKPLIVSQPFDSDELFKTLLSADVSDRQVIALCKDRK